MSSFSTSSFSDEPRRQGPRRRWYVAVGITLVLFLGFLLPWVRAATAVEQQANYRWISEPIAQVRQVKGVTAILQRLSLDPQTAVGSELLIDREGWQPLREYLMAHPRLNGWRLLFTPETSLGLRVGLILQAATCLGGLAWIGLASVKIPSETERKVAGGVAILSALALVLLIIKLPHLETLGRNDSIGLMLLMAIVEARPSWGAWLSLIGNVVLISFLVNYFVQGKSLWQTAGDGPMAGAPEWFYE
jgi:hypothetical protein